MPIINRFNLLLCFFPLNLLYKFLLILKDFLLCCQNYLPNLKLFDHFYRNWNFSHSFFKLFFTNFKIFHSIFLLIDCRPLINNLLYNLYNKYVLHHKIFLKFLMLSKNLFKRLRNNLILIKSYLIITKFLNNLNYLHPIIFLLFLNLLLTIPRIL